MMEPLKRLILGLTVLGALSLPRVADAQSASALILEKTGPTVPDIQAYREIPVGATVALSSGSRLVFLHYQTCQTVTVVGGQVTFQAFTYTSTGGGKAHAVRTPCPPTVRLRGHGEMAGVVLRSVLPEVRLSTSPAFVLVGDRADEFATVRVSQGGTTLVEAPLAGRGFRWPAGTATLAAQGDYELVLVPKATGKTPVTMKFRAEGDGGTVGGGPLTLISVD
jgi:hypothetical protein